MKSQRPTVEVSTDYAGTKEVETHPAFGVATVSRVQGSVRNLYQSDMAHAETIRLSISNSKRIRSYNEDRTTTEENIVEIEMSLAQWGALISSIGIGSGVPVTILNSACVPGHIPSIESEPRIQKNIDEVRASSTNSLAAISKSFDGLETAFNEKAGVRVLREKISALHYAIKNAPENSAFAVKQLQKAAENLVAQAKSDIEAHILQANTIVQDSVQLPAQLKLRQIESAAQESPYDS